MKRKHLFHSFAFLMTGLVTLTFGHVAQADNTTTAESNTNETVRRIEPKKDIYVIASDSASAPFEFQNTNDEYESIDVQLAESIAKLQESNIRMDYHGFFAVLQTLKSRQASEMIVGMTATDEKKESYDFSDSYFDNGTQLAVKKGSTSIKSYEDLRGKTIGAKVGTESAEFLSDHGSEYGYSIKYFDATGQLYDGLGVGAVDTMMDDYPVIDYAIKQRQELEIPIGKESGGKYALAAKKEQNLRLLNMSNEGLKELRRTGEYDKTIREYVVDGLESSSDFSAVDKSAFLGLIQNNYQALLKGLWRTILLTLISFALAIMIGVIFGLFSIAPIRVPHTVVSICVDIICGIPTAVLVFSTFFGLPGIVGFTIPDFVADVITLTLNASAYITEIARGGINAVPVGQMEASRNLGLSYNRTIQKIILPRAIHIMIPSSVNQFAISLKDTTIISAIGVVELLQTGKIIIARATQSTYVHLIIAIMYLILITALAKLAKVLEKKVK